MIAITGASGKLGGLAVRGLLNKIPTDQIVALVRDLGKAGDLQALGIELREADYDRPDTLAKALRGVDKLLLVSSVVPGQRLGHHKAVIDAARHAGVTLIAYTSMLRADSSTLKLANEHHQTELHLQQSGVPYVLLRNGWYLENTTEGLKDTIAQGVIIGSAGNGRLSSASRADYADAAVAVLTQAGHENMTYELAGDHSFSMAEFAAEASRQSGQPVEYRDLSAENYAAALQGFGLPPMIVDVVVDASLKTRGGELESSSRDLSRLLGRSTTSLRASITEAMAA
jgi:NAD(P)H dehydrogenase (quinone)